MLFGTSLKTVFFNQSTKKSELHTTHSIYVFQPKISVSQKESDGEKEDKAKQKNLPCEKQVENDNTNGYENSPMINERKATDYSVVDEQDAGG